MPAGKPGWGRAPNSRARAPPSRSDAAERTVPVTARDAQRGRVYAAEAFVRTMFDRAGGRAGRAVDFFGDQLTLPPEARFASVAAVAGYVDDVLALPGVRERWPAAEPLLVRARRGIGAAHYEHTGGDQGAAVVAVPDGDSRWALRELVVLHEIAHHLCRSDPPHGPEFTATLCDLAGAVMGAEVGYVLRVVYAKEGAR